jgi:hypothetical protein
MKDDEIITRMKDDEIVKKSILKIILNKINNNKKNDIKFKKLKEVFFFNFIK